MTERYESSEATTNRASPAIIERIVQAVNGIRFGAVEIVIHEGRIVQIERREKLRFDATHNRRPDR